MRALLFVILLGSGCAVDDSEQAESNYQDLSAQVTESCGTFRTTVPSLACVPPALDVSPIETCMTTHLTDLAPARADGFAKVMGGKFEMNRVIYTAETYLFVVDGDVIVFDHNPEYTSYSDFGDATHVDERWTEKHCTGIAATTGSNCPSVVATGCD